MADFKIDTAAASGNTTLVAAVAGKRVRVHSLFLQAAGSVNVTLKDGTTALTGPLPEAAETGFALNHNPCGHYTLGVNSALVLTTDAAVQVSGSGTYSLIG